jgi:hypothetical protein
MFDWHRFMSLKKLLAIITVFDYFIKVTEWSLIDRVSLLLAGIFITPALSPQLSWGELKKLCYSI